MHREPNSRESDAYPVRWRLARPLPNPLLSFPRPGMITARVSRKLACVDGTKDIASWISVHGFLIHCFCAPIRFVTFYITMRVDRSLIKPSTNMLEVNVSIPKSEIFTSSSLQAVCRCFTRLQHDCTVQTLSLGLERKSGSLLKISGSGKES